jgi:hypothetical protein
MREETARSSWKNGVFDLPLEREKICFGFACGRPFPLIELIRLGRRSESDKDFEILLLRRQLAIYERQQGQEVH